MAAPDPRDERTRKLLRELAEIHKQEDPRAEMWSKDLAMAKGKSKAAYMISSIAEQYEIHPQTLRLYEREGLLKPSRSEGNTRLYTAEDIERLEVILHLTRDLGVNLAGVEIILNMREKMGEMQRADPGICRHLEPGTDGSRRRAAPGGRAHQPDSGDQRPCSRAPPVAVYCLA